MQSVSSRHRPVPDAGRGVAEGVERMVEMSERIVCNDNGGELREEIVRCRDCKLHVKKGRRLYCELNAGGFPEVEPDGFCAWGERK